MKKEMHFTISGVLFTANRTVLDNGILWFYYDDHIITMIILDRYKIKFHFTSDRGNYFNMTLKEA